MSVPDPFEMALDVCGVCGVTIGYGIRALHLGVCEDCRDHEATDGKRPVSRALTYLRDRSPSDN